MPAGTVDFSTTISGPVALLAISRAACSNATRLTSPDTPGGVPTQMNTPSAPDTASPISLEKDKRPAASCSRNNSCPPGS